MQAKDSTATHFKANKKRDDKGYAIVLYRFMTRDHVQTTIDDVNGRPQYLGPLGWNFHGSTKDSDVIPKLLPIDKLEEVTGDDLEKEIWQEGNIYAG
jgi:hypothetical protein